MIQQQEFTQAKQKSCSNCGASFSCGASAENTGCWCNDLPHISPVTPNEEDCLCPHCLKEAIAKVYAGEKAVES